MSRVPGTIPGDFGPTQYRPPPLEDRSRWRCAGAGEDVVLMQALVVYESMYGNTHAVAVEVAAGLRAMHEVTLVPVTRATRELVTAADVIVAGSPTHMHGMPTVASRRMAAE